ncbi:MAG TPA: hypothetical protein DCP06_05160 [Lachnospiraceae bacterium]|nr:hypothetical protein [Lachnospiraceae bacterium]
MRSENNDKDMTSFLEGLRSISIEGLEEIGKGGNGTVYRLDPETIVKVYYGDRNTVEKINHNREVTKSVFVQGIPTTIAFDMVRVGDNYGVVYEMIDAKSLSHEIVANPDKLEYYANLIADTLKTLHSTEFEKGTLPNAKEAAYRDVKAIYDCGVIDSSEVDILHKMIDNVPDRYTFIHQDFHPGNIMLQKGEPVLIDVEDAGLGHPVFDLSSMYLVYVTAAHVGNKGFEGISAKQFDIIWDLVMKRYFGTTDDKKIADLNRVLLAYSRIKYLRGVATSPRVPKLLRKTVPKFIKKKVINDAKTISIADSELLMGL